MAIDIPAVTSDPFALMTARSKGNSLQKQEIENKYAPLEMRIKAQNALTYNNRMGNAGLFLRSIAQLPTVEREQWLADPTNRQNYMNQIETYRSGINNPNANGNVLTPDYVRSFGEGGNQGYSNPFSGLIDYFSGRNNNNPVSSSSLQNPSPIQQQAAPAQQSSVPAQGTPPSSNEEYGAVNQANDEMVEDISKNGNSKYNNTGNKVQPKELTQQERGAYSAQLQTNNLHIGPDLKKRADAGIAFEGFLQQARPYLSKAFSDAFEYSQIYGKGQNWLEKFKKDQPEKYQNYIFAKDSASKLIANGVRFLESMGVSHEAQKEANDLVSQLDKIDVSPETGRNVFNKTMRALYDVSGGVLKSAEPTFPGVRRKLAGVPEFKGDFIPVTKKSKNVSKVPSGKKHVKNIQNGNEYYIPSNRLEAYTTNGYEEIK